MVYATPIGQIRLSYRVGLVRYGKLRPCAYTVVEYFDGPETCDGQPYSRVRWPERGVVIHETGGAVVRSTPAYFQLW